MTDMETETDKVVSDILFDDNDEENCNGNGHIHGSGIGGAVNDQEDFDASLTEAMAEAAAFLDSGDDDDDNELSIQQQQQQLCVHPEHAHSFSKATFLAVGLRPPPCAGCHQSLKKPALPVPDPSIVKCVACGVLAHRSCALSPVDNSVVWNELCSVNGPSIKRATGIVSEQEGKACLGDDHQQEEECEEEYEMDLSKKLNDDRGDDSVTRQQQQQRVRKNSYASSDQSMATQELEEEAASLDGTIPPGAAAEASKTESDFNVSDPDVAAALQAAKIAAKANPSVKTEAQLESPDGTIGRKQVAKMVFPKKQQDTGTDDNPQSVQQDQDDHETEFSQFLDVDEEGGHDNADGQEQTEDKTRHPACSNSAESQDTELDNSQEELPDMQDIEIEIGNDRAQVTASKSKFRLLFARKEQKVEPTSQNKGEQNDALSGITHSESVATEKRRSLLNWRKTTEQEEDGVAGKNVVEETEGEEKEETGKLENSVTDDQNHWSQPSFLTRFFNTKKEETTHADDEASKLKNGSAASDECDDILQSPNQMSLLSRVFASKKEGNVVDNTAAESTINNSSSADNSNAPHDNSQQSLLLRVFGKSAKDEDIHEENVEMEEASESQQSFFPRVFTRKKADDNETASLESATKNEAEEDSATQESFSRRFLFFSKKDTNENATDDKDSNIPGGMAPTRNFSLFGFRKESTNDVCIQRTKAWASDEPPSHWATSTTPTFQASPAIREDGNNEGVSENTDSIPLHYANHPFASVSRALQDNILALLKPPDEIEETVVFESEPDECNGTETSPRKPFSSLSLIVSPEESVDVPGLGEIRPKPESEPEQKNALLEVASGTYEAVKATARVPQKIGRASVVGGIAGGVAGLMFSGPAGAMMGFRYGQTAGALGVVLEGSFTVGVIIAGVSGGRIAADKIQEQIEEQRVLTIGEDGVTRKVMLVRPTIRIDPVWQEIWAEAQRTSPTTSTSTLSLFFTSASDSIKQERYERTSDIVEEEEIPTDEKVLLLVSRVLSDKGSFPGHVYRCLMQAFKDRCQQRNELKVMQEKEDFPHLFEGTAEESVNMGNEVEISSSSRARREDCHGVIKYITATLLEVRPGLASTPEITEITASVVEALVFGEIYDLVYEEIAMETTETDKRLIEKIDDFEFARVQLTGVPISTERVVSQEAICALRRLPETHAAVDKLRHCVAFLEKISEHFSSISATSTMGADSLLKMVCQHLIAAKMPGINAEVACLEEFAHDQQLLRGKEGYALVTLQASLHFLNMSSDFERDIFGQDDDEENVPLSDEKSSKSNGGHQVDAFQNTEDANAAKSDDSDPTNNTEAAVSDAALEYVTSSGAGVSLRGRPR